MPSVANERLFGLSAAVAVKAPATVATTGPITLEGLQTVDAVALSTGDRVLVKDQADAKANGVYRVETGAWPRAADFNDARDVVSGTRLYVTGGGINGAREFVLTSPGDITIGTSELGFAAVAALGTAASVIAATRAIATAGQTDFSLSYTAHALLLTVNGAIVDEADYVAADGVSISFLKGLNIGDAVVAYSINGDVNAPTAAFHARLATTSENVTGSGALATVVFDAVQFDDGDGDYDPATGVYTVPKPGRYQFNAAATLDNVTLQANQVELRLVTADRNYFGQAFRSNDMFERTTLGFSVLLDMDVGETVSVVVRVSGEAGNTVDLIGGEDGFAHFSGFLVR